MEKEFYLIVVEIYRTGYSEHQEPLITATEICADDLTEAKVYACGYVATQMFNLKKLQENGVLPSEGLEAFLSANADTNFETLYRTYLIGDEKYMPVQRGKLHGDFKKSDEVRWKIRLVPEGDSPEYKSVYDSNNDTGDIIDNLLKKAISEVNENKGSSES